MNSKQVFLAADTSYSHGRVVLFNEKNILREIALKERMRHGEFLPSAIKDVLDHAKKNDQKVSAIFCGLGPGSFVGIRLSLALMLGYSLASKKPIMGFCSHDALFYSQNSNSLSLFMKASGNLGYFTRYDKGERKGYEVIEVKEFFFRTENGLIITDKPNMLGNEEKRSSVVEVQGPSAVGIKKACLDALHIAGGVRDESSFIKPNYVKPPSVSYPKKQIII